MISNGTFAKPPTQKIFFCLFFPDLCNPLVWCHALQIAKNRISLFIANEAIAVCIISRKKNIVFIVFQIYFRQQAYFLINIWCGWLLCISNTNVAWFYQCVKCLSAFLSPCVWIWPVIVLSTEPQWHWAHFLHQRPKPLQISSPDLPLPGEFSDRKWHNSQSISSY